MTPPDASSQALGLTVHHLGHVRPSRAGSSSRRGMSETSCMLVRMRVFISSVRRGLESERDALPGLLIATGFEPARFEDFGALPTPSREACVRGVQASDVYLLLLGPAYGDPLPETGQSP